MRNKVPSKSRNINRHLRHSIFLISFPPHTLHYLFPTLFAFEVFGNPWHSYFIIRILIFIFTVLWKIFSSIWFVRERQLRMDAHTEKKKSSSSNDFDKGLVITNKLLLEQFCTAELHLQIIIWKYIKVFPKSQEVFIHVHLFMSAHGCRTIVFGGGVRKLYIYIYRHFQIWGYELQRLKPKAMQVPQVVVVGDPSFHAHIQMECVIDSKQLKMRNINSFPPEYCANACTVPVPKPEVVMWI